MVSKDKDVMIMTELYLTGSQISAISERFGWVKEEQARGIGRVASGMIQDLVNGGMMLPPMVMKRLQESVGASIEDSATMIELVERGAYRDGGRVMVPIYLDPLYQTNLQERADAQGIDIKTFLQNFIDQVIEAGWLYSVDPPPFSVRFSPEDYNAIRKLCGLKDVQPLFGDDILKLLPLTREAKEELTAV